MNALFDAFASAAPRDSSLQLHGNDVADALVAWATDHGLSTEIEDRKLDDGRTWKSVSLRFQSGAWIAAHREFDHVAAAEPVASVLESDPIAF